MKFTGAFTALITPMKDSGEVDFEGYKRLLDLQIKGGIDGFVPVATTGETPTLDEDEEEEIIRLTVEAAGNGAKNGGKKIPVIAGAGSNSTRHAVQYTERAKRLGADAVLMVTPYYNKPNDSGLLRHFQAVAEVGLPVIIYNIAGRTGRNIPTPLMQKLAEIPGIAGVKEASGDINQITEVLRLISLKKQEAGGDFTVLSGDDALTFPVISLGGHGVVSVVSNIFPSEISKLVRLALQGDFTEARKLHFKLLPFVHAVFVETNPAPVKYAMSLAGLPSGPCRLPLGELSPASKKVVQDALGSGI